MIKRSFDNRNERKLGETPRLNIENHRFGETSQANHNQTHQNKD